jgi:hypothetical protein
MLIAPWPLGCVLPLPCSKARGSCAPGAIAVLLWVHLATALWFLLMHPQMLPPYSDAAAAHAARGPADATCF